MRTLCDNCGNYVNARKEENQENTEQRMRNSEVPGRKDQNERHYKTKVLHALGAKR